MRLISRALRHRLLRAPHRNCIHWCGAVQAGGLSRRIRWRKEGLWGRPRRHGPRVRTLKSDPFIEDRRSALTVRDGSWEKRSRAAPPLLGSLA